jgi:GAF domain-containing protein
MFRDAASSPDIVQNTFEQANLLTDIIAKLHRCKQESQIFSTTVNLVREAIQCDRVVICRLKASNRGKIVAESVATEYPEILNMTIVDPFFDDRYIQYERGQVRAISNIYQEGMSSYYIDNLEKMGVKANLSVPILSTDNNIYGLLVLHQCTMFREWQKSEIDLMIQIATQVDYAMSYLANSIECVDLRAELQKANDLRELTLNISQKLDASRNCLEVLQIAASEIQCLLKCDRIVAYSLQASSRGKIMVENIRTPLAPILGQVITDPCFDSNYREQYQNGQIRAIDDIYTASMSHPYVENLNKIGVKSNLEAPILLGNSGLWGLLVAYQCFEYHHWSSTEIEQVRQITIQAGLTLTKIRIHEKQALLVQALTKMTKMMFEVKERIQLALKTSISTELSLKEIFSILGETSKLTHLLKKEIMESTQLDTLESQRLLHIIAMHLQGHVDQWQNIEQVIKPQQQHVAELLEAILNLIENDQL